MKREYRFDYSKARPNRFAKKTSGRTVVVLDPDIAKIFPTSDETNRALRALLEAMRPTRSAESTRKQHGRRRAA